MKAMKLAWLLCCALVAGRVSAFETQQISIPSAAMGKASNATVILPDDYRQGTNRFPTVYLLHGWSGNNLDWSEKGGVGKLADQYHLILVMPDGGFDKWYIDSPVSPRDKYETYVGNEVVAFVDHAYRTVAEKGGRAITGLSMGGFGALNIALNYPETFGTAGSISGGVDPREFTKSWGIANAFGDRVKNAEFWNEKAIVDNVDRFLSSGIDVAIDCGVDDFFIESNRALHRRMLELKVRHDYTERPGGHSWDYWSNAIKYQLLFVSTKFDEKLRRK